MTHYYRRLACILPVMLCFFGCGPVPGGPLSGKLAGLPADWSPLFDDGHALCEIESRTIEPHSIQLDCFLYRDQVHVQSHRWALASWWPVESWAAIWIQHPMIRLRIGSDLFELRAVHISDPAERQGVLEFRGYDPVPEGIVAFRFVPRP